MSLKNWNFFREKSEFLRDISISLKTVVRRGLPNAYSDLSCCLSCEDRISLLSLLAKQKSRLSRVTVRLGRNVVV